MSRESNKWERINAISSLALVIVGAGALLFAYFQIKEARNEAKIQHLVEVVQEFDGPHYSDMRRRLAIARIDPTQKNLRPLDVTAPPDDMIDLLDFYQHIGRLVTRGYLDPDDVYSEFSDPMFLLYTDARPLIDARQKEEIAVWGDFTDLIAVMKRIDEGDNAGAGDHPSTEDMFEQYNADAASPAREPLLSKGRSSQIKK